MRSCDRTERPLRIVVVSPSHPEVNKGGAEIAAFALFEELLRRQGCQAWFLGCDRGASGDRSGSVIRQPYSEREYIYAAAEFDWFKFANRDPMFPTAFAALLTELKPDIVHFHHYAVIGVEALAIVR